MSASNYCVFPDQSDMVKDRLLFIQGLGVMVAESPMCGTTGKAREIGTVYSTIARGGSFALIFSQNPAYTQQTIQQIYGVSSCVLGSSVVSSAAEGRYNCFVVSIYEEMDVVRRICDFIKHVTLQKFTPMARKIAQEWCKQFWSLNCIASESIASDDVRALQGSVLTNKYAEGYPGARYYSGCHVVDAIEVMAQESAKKLFGCEFVNVQPHSGSQANQAVYQGLIKCGDTY